MLVCAGGWVLVEEREDPAAPRRRGGVVVRERDLRLSHTGMASMNIRMEKIKSNRESWLRSVKSLRIKWVTGKREKEYPQS